MLALRRDFAADQYAEFKRSWTLLDDETGEPLALDIATARWRNNDDPATDIALTWDPVTARLSIDTVWSIADSLPYDIRIVPSSGPIDAWYFLFGDLTVTPRSTP